MMPSLLTLLITLITVSQVVAGVWTSNNFFYKPDVGARGAQEKAIFDSGLDRVDTRLGNERWLNDMPFGGNLQATIAAIGNTTTVLNIPSGTWPIASDLTVPANITIKLLRGAILNIGTGKTLTINGTLEAGCYQIFSCTGTGKVLFGAGTVKEVYPQWWGVTNSSGDDNQTALQKCLDSGAKNIAITDTHYYSGDINLSLDNVTVLGRGGKLITKTKDSRLLITGDNCETNGVFFDSVAPPAPDTGTRPMVHFQLCNNPKSRNCRFENAPFQCLMFDTCTHITATGNRINDSSRDNIHITSTQFGLVSNNVITKTTEALHGDDGVMVMTKIGQIANQSTDIVITGNFIDLNGGNSRGIVNSGSKRVNITNNTVRRTQSAGIYVTNGAGYSEDPEDTIIANNIVEQCPIVGTTIPSFGAIQADGYAGHFAKNTKISHNQVIGPVGAPYIGIKCAPHTQDSEIDGNSLYEIYGSNSVGIYARGKNITTTRNRIINTAHDLSYGFATGLEADGVCRVIGNEIILASGLSLIANGFDMEGIGATLKTTLIDNVVSAPTIGGAAVYFPSPGANDIIKNNVGYVSENAGTSAAISTGGSIAHGLAKTPTFASVTPAEAGPTDVTATVNATNITVTFGGGGSKTFFWSARIAQSK
jgi:hypothetical protein